MFRFSVLNYHRDNVNIWRCIFWILFKFKNKTKNEKISFLLLSVALCSVQIVFKLFLKVMYLQRILNFSFNLSIKSNLI